MQKKQYFYALPPHILFEIKSPPSHSGQAYYTLATYKTRAHLTFYILSSGANSILSFLTPRPAKLIDTVEPSIATTCPVPNTL